MSDSVACVVNPITIVLVAHISTSCFLVGTLQLALVEPFVSLMVCLVYNIPINIHLIMKCCIWYITAWRAWHFYDTYFIIRAQLFINEITYVLCASIKWYAKASFFYVISGSFTNLTSTGNETRYYQCHRPMLNY